MEYKIMDFNSKKKSGFLRSAKLRLNAMWDVIAGDSCLVIRIDGNLIKETKNETVHDVEFSCIWLGEYMPTGEFLHNIINDIEIMKQNHLQVEKILS